MAVTKVVKNKSYYSRYQVKYRRRREGKTDYYARKRLITQAKNKYASPKFRLVVRFTKRDVIAQIISAELDGDKVFAAAYAHELPRYGIAHGLTNWAAAYATGLLLARRALTKLGLADRFKGVEEPDGAISMTEAAGGENGDDERRPFKCVLDVGLARTTTGARVFGALKGASDGGLYVPHADKRFPGYDVESKELDADTVRKYIFGGHVSDYMEHLADNDEERFKGQFGKYEEDGLEAGGLEDMYSKAHAAIRAHPNKADPAAAKGTKKTREQWKAETLKHRQVKLTHKQRRDAVATRIKGLAAAA